MNLITNASLIRLPNDTNPEGFTITGNLSIYPRDKFLELINPSVECVELTKSSGYITISISKRDLYQLNQVLSFYAKGKRNAKIKLTITIDGTATISFYTVDNKWERIINIPITTSTLNKNFTIKFENFSDEPLFIAMPQVEDGLVSTEFKDDFIELETTW